MQQELRDHVNEYKKNNRKKSVWRKVVQGLACCVVFCTTYALILPAITMKQDTFCGQDEHVHTQECYVQDTMAAVLICPLEETEGETVPTVSGNDAIVFEEGMGMDGAESGQVPHKHTAECYAIPAQDTLTCGLEEGPEHTHDFLCYGSWSLVCEKEEHTHSLACFSDPNADVESAVVWEQMIAGMTLSGDWTEDVVSIAQKQIGYKESTLNYQVLEDGSLRGYTRYGAWSGAPYGEWNTMFVNFCIAYAGVEGMPVSANCQEWKTALEGAGLYKAAQGYEPQPGNVIFLDENGDGLAERAGIVAEVFAATEEMPAQIKSIQGNVDKQVQYVNYDLNAVNILGYSSLPKQPAPVYQYSDATVQVDVLLPEGSAVPRNAQLKVVPIGQDNASYVEMLQQAKDIVDGEVAGIRFYDISFYDKDGTYIPVKDWAQVTMTFAGDEVDSMEDAIVLHYGENQEEPVVLDNMMPVEITDTNLISKSYAGNAQNVEKISFVTHGFSVFAVVDVQTGTASTYYETRILNDVTGMYWYLDGTERTFILQTAADMVDDSLDAGRDTRIALYAEMVTVRENGANRQTLRGVEVVHEDGVTTSPADSRLLWRFFRSGVEGHRTIYIQSVATSQYLYIDGEGRLALSDTPQEFTCNANAETYRTNFLFVGEAATGTYLAFYSQEEMRNTERIHVFTTTNVDDTAHKSILLTEFLNDSEVTDNTEYITNLGGKTLAIVAVNNILEDGVQDQNITYPALASTSEGEGELIGSDIYTATVVNHSLEISNENDINNRLAWAFTDTGKPGSYYIQAANFYGTPNADNSAGKYLNISATGLSVSENKQAIEVIPATITYEDSSPVWNDVVCLRAEVDGVYYTVQLNGNVGTRNFTSSGTVQDNPTDPRYRANHFVLVSLAEPADVQFMNWVDSLPARREFDAVVGELPTFAEQTAYREELRRIAQKAIAYYYGSENDWTQVALNSVQLNFIGKDRIDKLLDLEWLWRKDPNTVEAASPDVTVKLFNYTEAINNYYFDADQLQRLGFYSWDPNEKTIDENRPPTQQESWAPTMSAMLSAEGYPVITRIPVLITYTDDEGNEAQRVEWQDVTDGELDYLFDSRYQVATMQDGGGLFRQDDSGYYYYFSDMNAAYFNGTDFTLYDVVVRPEYTRLEHGAADSDTNDSRSNFLPFDKVLGNVIYDDEALFGPNGEAFGDDEDTVKTRYDNYSEYSEIETQTAYLNDRTDLWFGMTLDYNFFIPKNATVDGKEMVFEFHGDDDVFVYIDDVLVLDIGGAHAARNGSINFTTGAVYYQTDLDENGDGVPEEGVQDVYTTLREVFREALIDQQGEAAANEMIEAMFDGDKLADNTMHNLKFFYVERGGTYSYAGIKFNMPTIPENSLVVGKERTQDEGVIDAQNKYSFRIVDATDTGKPYVTEGTHYVIYEDGNPVGNGTVGEGGIFTLQANQRALFAGVLDTERDDKTFIVQELIPANIDGQYRVFYSDDISTNNLIVTPSTEGDVKVYSIEPYSVDGSNGRYTKNVLFTNEVVTGNLDTLKITKKAGDGTQIGQEEVFNIYVQVASDRNSTLSPIPVGTQYTVNSEVREVTTAGIIPLKENETAIITGFLSGTYWTIEEIDLAKYAPKYSGTAKKGTIEPSGNAGTFGLADTVEFTVTNHAGLIPLTIPISKEAVGNDSSYTFDFVAELGIWDGNGNWTKTRDLHSGTITVTNASVTLGEIAVNLQSTDDGDNVFIKVYERNNGGSYVYDDTFYLVQFVIREENGEMIAQLDGAFKHGDGSAVSTYSPLPFVNQKVSSFTVEKEVINVSNPSDLSGEFAFEATITVNGAPYTELSAPDNGLYTVDNVNGKVFFTLENGESVQIPVPEGAVITVAETSTTGYSTSHWIAHGTQDPSGDVHSATTTEITVGASGVTVHYINRTGYELPMTGGSATNIYLLGGLMTLIAFAGFFILRMRHRSS